MSNSIIENVFDSFESILFSDAKNRIRKVVFVGYCHFKIGTSTICDEIGKLLSSLVMRCTE
jgi:hypothetical protein